jgi:hypothetical protein
MCSLCLCGVLTFDNFCNQVHNLARFGVTLGLKF